MEKEVIIIAAVAKNGVIGNGMDLPWRLPKDLKYFAEATKGHTVIMGRKTWESIPLKYKPLPDRKNIVISRQDMKIHGAETFNNLKSAIETSTGKVFIIGGGEIYKLALPLADKLMLTKLQCDFN
jgi:dihydrofolate reductase